MLYKLKNRLKNNKLVTYHSLSNSICVNSVYGEYLTRNRAPQALCSYSYQGWGIMSIHDMSSCHMLMLPITCGSYSYHGLGNHVHSRHGFMSMLELSITVVHIHVMSGGIMSILVMGSCHMLVLSITCGSYSYHVLGNHHVHSWHGFMSHADAIHNMWFIFISWVRESCLFSSWVHVTCWCYP
jgi:hypothetical protein